MAKENVIINFRLKIIDEKRHDLLHEIKHNDLMKEKYRKVCRAVDCFEHFFSFRFCSPWLCFDFWICFISWYACRLCVVGLKRCALTVRVKKYKSIMKKKKKKHDKIVLLAKTKLNTIEVLVFKTLIDWYTNHYEFFFSKPCLKRT